MKHVNYLSMIPDKEYEKIERFVNSEMPEVEQTVFKEEINKNKELAKVVALYQDLPNHLNNIQADLDFNKKLQSARDNYPKTTSKTNSWKWLVIGIISIIAVGLIWKQFFSANSTGTEEEIEQSISRDIPIANLWNDTDMPPAYITRSGKALEADIETYQNAHQLYAQKNYTEALSSLKAITPNSEVYVEMLLLKGVVQFELNQYEDAIQTYDDYIKIGAEPQDMVLWYQALTYIKAKQVDKAKSNLQTIIDNDYSKAEIAKTLLEQL